MKTAKWQTKTSCGCLAASLCVPIGRTSPLSVTQSAAAAAVRGLWRYISVGPYLIRTTVWLQAKVRERGLGLRHKLNATQ